MENGDGGGWHGFQAVVEDGDGAGDSDGDERGGVNVKGAFDDKSTGFVWEVDRKEREEMEVCARS